VSLEQYGLKGAHQFVTSTSSCPPPHILESVEINGPGWVCREDSLHECEQPLHALEELPSGFIVHDVRGVHCVPNLLPGTAVVDTNAGHTNGPGSVACIKD